MPAGTSAMRENARRILRRVRMRRRRSATRRWQRDHVLWRCHSTLPLASSWLQHSLAELVLKPWPFGVTQSTFAERGRSRQQQIECVGVGDGIAQEQPPRLAPEPMHPLKTDVLHPCRSPRIITGNVVETPSRGDEPPCAKLVAIAHTKCVFEGHPQTNPDDICARCVNAFAQGCLFLPLKVTMVTADYLQAGIPALHHRHAARVDFFLPAKHEHAQAVGARGGGRIVKEIRCRRAFRDWSPRQSRCEYDRLPNGMDNVGDIIVSAKLCIHCHHRDGMAVGGENQFWFPVLACSSREALRHHKVGKFRASKARYLGPADDDFAHRTVRGRNKGIGTSPRRTPERNHRAHQNAFLRRKTSSGVRKRILRSRSSVAFRAYQTSQPTLRRIASSVDVEPRKPLTCAQPVIPGLTRWRSA